MCLISVHYPDYKRTQTVVWWWMTLLQRSFFCLIRHISQKWFTDSARGCANAQAGLCLKLPQHWSSCVETWKRWCILLLICPKAALHYSWNNMFCCYSKVTPSLGYVYQSRLQYITHYELLTAADYVNHSDTQLVFLFFFLLFVKRRVSPNMLFMSPCEHTIYGLLSLCCSQSPQRRLLHAGGQETEAQGRRFGKISSSAAFLCSRTRHVLGGEGRRLDPHRAGKWCENTQGYNPNSRL